VLRSRPPRPLARFAPVLVALALLVCAGLTGPIALTAAPAPQGATTAPALRPPAVLAKSAYVLDVATGQPLFQKFATQRRPMASTTKLMTGLLAAESGRLEEVATVSKRAAAVGETSMGLVEGEQVSLLDLLYGLMLNSGNDAAIVLAEHLAGSEAAFVERMNARATALGLNDTHFGTVHGLDHAQYRPLTQYSSARDLAVLGANAMTNPTLARVAGTTMKDVPGPPGKEPHRLRHTVSAVWWYPGTVGGKTGWTERAGQVRVVVTDWGGTNRRLVGVVMDSPDNVGEIRDLLDYGYARVSKIVPTGADAFPPPDPRLVEAWGRYKSLALTPEGRVRAGQGGGGATADAQAGALLHAVWFRDRAAFDALWGWTKASLSRRQTDPQNTYRDALFASRWGAAPGDPAQGAVADWANSTAADQRIGAALLLASRLWNEPAYAAEARPVLDAVLNRAAVSWQNTGVPAPTLGIPAANSFLKGLEPVTTSGATLTPAFYRMFAEGTRNAIWLSLLDGAYLSLDRAAGDGFLPAWFSVGKDGRVGAPVDPTWQTGFGAESPALALQLALDLRWHGDRRAQALLAPAARTLGQDLTQRRQIAAVYGSGGAGAGAAGAETARYGALAGIALPELNAALAPALRDKLEPALGGNDPERILDAIDGLWLLAGGPPDFWRIWWPPADLPTTRNDAVVPPPGYDPAATGPDASWRYFEQTGHVVQGRFLAFFAAGGGVETFGYPRTEELQEDGRTVQYFQRGRLEAPAAAGAVALTPLGLTSARARGILSRPEATRRPPPPAEEGEGVTYVPESGHRLIGGFRDFYLRAGGLAVLGPPLTEELVEDGVTVQYFERAVLEYVPGQAVRPTLLGDQALRLKGWLA
jgi:D-alanyl-D-alanine carboxypeptidase/endo-1,4-beta-D-glucanase Y